VSVSSSSDYEAEANRVRKEIDDTIRELRSKLTPSSLASEAATGLGLTDASLANSIDFVSKRYPVPTAIAGVGVAFLALMLIRNRSRSGGAASLAGPLKESSESLLDSGARVFRDRASLKRRELVRIAQARIASGAEKLADELEKKLDDVVANVPGGSEARPLIASAIQIALTSALEGLLQRNARQS
jgi:hypothetical protein